VHFGHQQEIPKMAPRRQYFQQSSLEGVTDALLRYLSGAWIANKPGEVEHRLLQHRLDVARRDNDDVG